MGSKVSIFIPRTSMNNGTEILDQTNHCSNESEMKTIRKKATINKHTIFNEVYPTWATLSVMASFGW